MFRFVYEGSKRAGGRLSHKGFLYSDVILRSCMYVEGMCVWVVRVCACDGWSWSMRDWGLYEGLDGGE